MGTQPLFPATLKNYAVLLQNADGTTAKQLAAGGTGGTKVEAIAATNSDATNAVILRLSVTISSTTVILGEVTLPAGAGTNGTTKAVDVLSAANLPWLRSDGFNPYLYLQNGASLKGAAKSAVTSGETVGLFVMAGDL